MTVNGIKILVVSKTSQLVRQIKKIFSNKKFSVSWESQIDEILDYFESGIHDVVILASPDYKDQKKSLIKVVEEIALRSPVSQVLFLVEPNDIQFAMSALKLGTFQYAKLPVADEELELLIETSLERRPQIDGGQNLSKEQRVERFHGIIGRSSAMQQVYQQLSQAAGTEIPVLMLGETGTGKDLAAQVIYSQSERNEGPYIPVNLGALPSDLVASELFGYEKGAFTGAVKQHKGKFEQGNNGVVFLDEIDAIDEKVQVSLLRLIEQKKFHRLGGRRAVQSDARLITASNANLEEHVRVGSFREDLFFRLDVFRIEIPPLRLRQGDIPLLVEEFLGRYNQEFQKSILGISTEVLEILENYDWPGNVRELKNVIQRAVLVCDGETILPEHMPPRFHKNKSFQPKVTFEIGTSLEEVEREMIVRALSVAGNNRKRAAELLGISRRAIYNKLRKHKID